MKLKKIASLMLAGIMAVSMLAACGSKTPDPNPGEGEGEGNTASGYSAMLGEKAADDLYKSDRDGIFTFADNADDQKALEYVVSHEVDQNDIKNIISGDYVNDRDNTFVKGLWTAFNAKAKINNGIYGGLKNTTHVQGSVNSTRFAEFYVANGDVDMDTVMSEIYEDVKDEFTSAMKDGKQSDVVKVNYSYTVSVSVKNVPMTAFTDVNGSANFIAVTVTRTAEIA